MVPNAHCRAGVALTATDTIASPQFEFLLGQWSKVEFYSHTAPVPACTQALGPSTAPGVLHSLPATALPGVAFGHFISVFGLVIHSAQTAEKRQHQKQSPISKTQGRASVSEHRPAPVLLTISATDAADRPFQTTQENSEGKAPLKAPEAGGSSRHSSSPMKSPVLSYFLFPTSRSSLENAHARREEPGHPTPSRHLVSLLQKAGLAQSEPPGQHEELFHPASPQLFYPSTFKNNGAIQLFKTKVVCFFSCGSMWSCLLLPPGQE